MSRTEYAVLIHGNEAAWAQASEQEQMAIFERHSRFAQLLEERGHTVTSGAELTPSSTARVLHSDAATATDGPYAEAAEQLGGFYLVASDDLDDLVEICKVLAVGGDTVEVRPTVDHGSDAG